jgi:hypothetical protein
LARLRPSGLAKLPRPAGTRFQSESDLESIAGEVIAAGQGAAHGGSNRSGANLRFQGAPERI